MTHSLKILVAQMNFLVGDCINNSQRIVNTLREAKEKFNADLVVFPELALTGYPPEDLLFRSDFQAMVKKELENIKQACEFTSAIVGFPHQTPEGLYNGAAFIEKGQLRAIYHKHLLPNYSVFDEKRYFIPGKNLCMENFQNFNLGLLICEDLWGANPTVPYKTAGAEVIIVINASPFHSGKLSDRYALLKKRTQETNLPIIYVNSVGGQDELVFDGGSFAMDSSGTIQFQSVFFEEQCCLITLEKTEKNTIRLMPAYQCPVLSNEALIYQGLVTGLRDYVKKNGFSGALIGLSGGIDSALALCIAVSALGHENVEAILMPSRYTAPISIEDAEQLANNLGVKYHSISIEPLFNTYMESLANTFAKAPVDITEENLQSRCRGTLLMAISNKQGKLVLATSNKSEIAVGYATLYGDMCGAFAPLKDVSKTMVYQLAHFINKDKASLIPERILTRAPTAELTFDQKDEDSLPPYEVLDSILQLYVEQDESVESIVKLGHDKKIVCEIIKKVEESEYKRRQAPPGVRITTRNFGQDRRYPITSGFKKSLQKL